MNLIIAAMKMDTAKPSKYTVLAKEIDSII
jgi:hypothetical protein